MCPLCRLSLLRALYVRSVSGCLLFHTVRRLQVLIDLAMKHCHTPSTFNCSANQGAVPVCFVNVHRLVVVQCWVSSLASSTLHQSCSLQPEQAGILPRGVSEWRDPSTPAHVAAQAARSSSSIICVVQGTIVSGGSLKSVSVGPHVHQGTVVTVLWHKGANLWLVAPQS